MKKITLNPVIPKVRNSLPQNEMYKYSFTEIDFVTFGTPPDLELLKEIEGNLVAFPIENKRLLRKKSYRIETFTIRI